jgi:hypothetical protein
MTGGEQDALSVLFQLDDVFDTYSVYARLRITVERPSPRRPDTLWAHRRAFEDSPPAWPRKLTYG